MGAADRALSLGPRSEVSSTFRAVLPCTSLKSNMGHLEAAAAAAGLASLVVGPLLAAVVGVNAQLRRSAGETRDADCETLPENHRD